GKVLQSSLALSSLHARLEELEKENLWLLKQIKRKRTELNNFVEQMRSLGTEIFTRSAPSLNRVTEINQEIHALFAEIFTTRKFGKKSKKDVEAVYRNLQMAGIISPNRNAFTKDEFGDEEEDFVDSESREDENDSPPFGAGFYEDSGNYQQSENDSSSTDEEPQKDSKSIRKAFLRLAEIFHPDKVKDDETQIEYTEIMKEINSAYQEGDLARLLEIEKQHQVGEKISGGGENGLSKKCNLLDQDNEFLKEQYENLKQELRLLKRTPEGTMVSDFRKAKKEGIDPIAMMIEQVQSEVEIISSIRDFVKDFRDKKISIKEFLNGPPILRQMQMQRMEDLFDEMLEELGLDIEDWE
ncbi:MAG: J domain-containing protein, partial [Cyanobacteria bacterium P01_A01_bin.84]